MDAMLEVVGKRQYRCKSYDRGECSRCSPLRYVIQINHKSIPVSHAVIEIIL